MTTRANAIPIESHPVTSDRIGVQLTPENSAQVIGDASDKAMSALFGFRDASDRLGRVANALGFQTYSIGPIFMAPESYRMSLYKDDQIGNTIGAGRGAVVCTVTWADDEAFQTFISANGPQGETVECKQ